MCAEVSVEVLDAGCMLLLEVLVDVLDEVLELVLLDSGEVELVVDVDVLDDPTVDELLDVLLVLVDVNDAAEEGLDLLDVEVEVVLMELVLEDVDVELDVLNEPEVSVEVLDELDAELLLEVLVDVLDVLDACALGFWGR